MHAVCSHILGFTGFLSLMNFEKCHICSVGVTCCVQMDLMPFVNKAGCECLNESDDCGFDNCLIKDSSYLESDCDEQVEIPLGS